MKAYAKYLIAGWFDLMGIENGVNYIRFNGSACTYSTWASCTLS